MPYLRRRVSRSGTKLRRSMRGQPRLSTRNRIEIMQAKANIDQKTMMYTTYITGAPYAATADANGDAIMSSCPLYNLVGASMNSTNGAQLKANYTEYRVKKVTVHVMINNVQAVTNQTIGNVHTLVTSTTTNLTICENVVCSVAWGRAGAFASNPTGLATTVMALLPQCKQWCWNLSNVEKPEFWSSCTADQSGGYNDWLSTTVIPTTAPNTGKFFCPIFNFTMGSAYTGTTITCHVEEECIVEVRGSKY